MKLFCLPYAGGHSQVFTKWKKVLSPTIHVHPIDLPGRGKRKNLKEFKNFKTAVQEIGKELHHLTSHESYAIFGHSMGGLIAYEITVFLQKMKMRTPDYLFISGMIPPHLFHKDVISSLPDEEFLIRVKRLGGTPEGFFNAPELIATFMPILRSDFKLLESYEPEVTQNKLETNVIAFAGKNDTSFNNNQSWKSYTNGDFERYCFDGNHFFINDQFQNICHVINSHLVK